MLFVRRPGDGVPAFLISISLSITQSPLDSSHTSTTIVGTAQDSDQPVIQSSMTSELPISLTESLQGWLYFLVSTGNASITQLIDVPTDPALVTVDTNVQKTSLLGMIGGVAAELVLDAVVEVVDNKEPSTPVVVPEQLFNLVIDVVAIRSYLQGLLGSYPQSLNLFIAVQHKDNKLMEFITIPVNLSTTSSEP